MNFELNKKQYEKYIKWNEKHGKKCLYKNNIGVIGGRISFIFMPTSLGVATEVTCACGDKINLTDYDEW